mmetsp:Transcript_8011/g.11950  ORF Transcript_8011/g.11950 Transcript_8011/m.11950 type:complete len:628 (-) Transcript_8011:201-2084(-)
MSDVTWDLSLRCEQPVEGCELTPHAYLKLKSRTLDNPAKAKVLEANPHTFSFKWSRGPTIPMCAYSSCPRNGTTDPLDWSRFSRGGPSLRCAVCEKLGIPRHEALFCSVSCFKNAWPTHIVSKHPRSSVPAPVPPAPLSKPVVVAGIVAERDSDDDVVDAEELDEGGYVEGHVPTSLMDTLHGGADGQWEEIFSEQTYIPTAEDVGKVLRIECRAVGKDCETLAGPVVVYTECVLSAPRLPPRRALHAVPNAGASLSSQSQVRFRVVSYNILAEIYATKHAYPYSDPWTLSWPYRRSIILQELADSKGDIICLQEVQADHYEQNLQPALSDMGYDGLYKQKTRESMGQHGKVDGCAVFWRRTKFIMVENYSIEFNEIVQRTASHLNLDDGDRRRFISRLSKDNIAQVLVLEPLSRPQQQRSRSASRICVVNTHLYSNHTRPEIKLWQSVQLMKEIESYVLNHDLALIICGDFNSEPESAVYQYLSQGGLNEEHAHVVEAVAKNLVDVEALMHGVELESANYRSLGYEPEFTNYTRNFRGTLDYVWYTPSRLKLLAVTSPPSEADILTHCEGLPSVQYPSDHIMLCCDVALMMGATQSLRGGGMGQVGSSSGMLGLDSNKLGQPQGRR